MPVLHDGTTVGPEGLVVCGAPSGRDVDESTPLSGPTGDKFDDALESAQLQRDRLLIVPVIACAAKEPLEEDDMKKAVECCASMRDYYLELAGDVPRLIMGKWPNLALGFTRPLDGKKGARGFLYDK